MLPRTRERKASGHGGGEGVEAEPVSPPAEACRACWWRWRWVHEAAGINGRTASHRRCEELDEEALSSPYKVARRGAKQVTDQ